MKDMCLEKFEYANKLIFVKKYVEAEKQLDECLRIPGCQFEPLVHFRRIELMWMLEKHDGMRQSYQKMVDSTAGLSAGDKVTVQALWAIVNLFLETPDSSRYEDARQSLETLTRAEAGPKALVFFGLAYSYWQTENFERALQYYEQALKFDRHWYPALHGMSQMYYQLGDVEKGDLYFQEFESNSPLSVYGNFETHRRLARDFLLEGRLDDAELSVQMLTNWWVEHRRFAPLEIQVYEQLATAKICHMRGDQFTAQMRQDKALNLTRQLLAEVSVDENVLYFLARVLEEHNELRAAFDTYKRLLDVAGSNPNVVQKVGSHFLAHGKIDDAVKLFDAAYLTHPDNPEVRFCLLIARLKQNKVAVEEYLMDRERMKRHDEAHGDPVEFLNLLSSLNQRFGGDSEVHAQLGDVFLRMGQLGKAGEHFKKMYNSDRLGQSSRLRYAHFLMTSGSHEEAMSVLNDMLSVPKNAEELKHRPSKLAKNVEQEVYWLKCVYHDRKSEWAESQALLKHLVDADPWNITYLIQEIVNLTGIQYGLDAVDALRLHWTIRLQQSDEAKVNWKDFKADTDKATADHAYALAYARSKLHFLYLRGHEPVLRSVVQNGCRYDAQRASRDFMRLLNTNFDSPAVYLGLGLLFKELWQLEVASMWFEEALSHYSVDDHLKSHIYVELADCFAWSNVNHAKAVEFCRVALDMGQRTPEFELKAMTTTAHALLLSGQPRQALAYIEHFANDHRDHMEIQYLLGLIQYRNGRESDAKSRWKPLLKCHPMTMRENKIKQEILKYYYELTPYVPHQLAQ
jgi:tetratricopeptide (TPR) repeat protein